MMRMGKRNAARGATGPPSMHLPPELYELFEGKPIELVTTTKEEQERVLKLKQTNPIEGVGKYLDIFEETVPVTDPPHQPIVIRHVLDVRAEAKKAKRDERRAKMQEKIKENQTRIEERLKMYDPHAKDDKKTENAYNTIFVGHLPKSATESKLTKHFERVGRVLAARIVQSGRYGFVEFERSDDVRRALSRESPAPPQMDGQYLVLDVERARTVKDWKPKALGGGVQRASSSYQNKRDRDGYSRASGDRYRGSGGGGSSRGFDDHHRKRRRY